MASAEDVPIVEDAEGRPSFVGQAVHVFGRSCEPGIRASSRMRVSRD